MSVPSTPSKRLTLDTATTPTTSRIAAASSTIHSSPHYQTTRRHSLYGTEDRIVIDPGSRIWKVGFSGEGRPRDVFFGHGEDGQALWGLSRATNQLDREEEDRMLQAKLQQTLRSVFHEYVSMNASWLDERLMDYSSLLTDPKSRRVIVIEHPLLPLCVKDLIARILFTNLQVCTGRQELRRCSWV
jgi:actin-related protein 10